MYTLTTAARANRIKSLVSRTYYGMIADATRISAANPAFKCVVRLASPMQRPTLTILPHDFQIINIPVDTESAWIFDGAAYIVRKEQHFYL